MRRRDEDQTEIIIRDKEGVNIPREFFYEMRPKDEPPMGRRFPIMLEDDNKRIMVGIATYVSRIPYAAGMKYDDRVQCHFSFDIDIPRFQMNNFQYIPKEGIMLIRCD